MSGLLMASTQPNKDLDLLAGDYAAIRPATRPESRRLGLRWPQRAFAVVLRSCAGIEVVVFPTGLTSRFLTVEKLDSFIAVRGYTCQIAPNRAPHFASNVDPTGRGGPATCRGARSGPSACRWSE